MKIINKELKEYVEKNIFPKYENNDYGHNIDHINYVINRSLNFAKTVENINHNMVYTVAAYHDIGHSIDAKNHEKISADILLKDKYLEKIFTEGEINIMSEAIYDHRASLEGEPRNIYGKIVSSADRNTLLSIPLIRTYSYRVVHSPNQTLNEIVEESRQHLIKKFGSEGYATEKMYFEDEEYKEYLKELQALLNDQEKFKKEYYRINEINNLEKNMGFLFDEISKNNNNFSLDEIIYYVYIKLNTKQPFYEIKKKLLELKKIDEFEYYIKDVGSGLINYIENNVFPKYEKNDKAHGLVHIKEVIRRSFALNQTFKLGLSHDVIYAIAAWHDINKYLDSDIHADLAAKSFLENNDMNKFFNKEEIKIISEAIADHCSSKEEEPRSIYGKLISSADRNTTIDMVFIRSFFVALSEGKKTNRDTIVEDYLDFTWKRLSKRYSEDKPENMFFEDDIYRIFLRDIRDLLKSSERFKDYYCEVNGITDKTKLVKEYDKPVIGKVLIKTL